MFGSIGVMKNTETLIKNTVSASLIQKHSLDLDAFNRITSAVLKLKAMLFWHWVML